MKCDANFVSRYNTVNESLQNWCDIQVSVLLAAFKSYKGQSYKKAAKTCAKDREKQVAGIRLQEFLLYQLPC